MCSFWLTRIDHISGLSERVVEKSLIPASASSPGVCGNSSPAQINLIHSPVRPAKEPQKHFCFQFLHGYLQFIPGFVQQKRTV